MNNSPWPMVKLGEVLTQYREYIDDLEPKMYPKLSVKLYGKGAVLDDPVNGLNVKMRRHQLAKSGQVILSEIWGKKGAIGFVPPEGEGALCTSHFFLFDVDETKVLSSYLAAIFQGNYLQPQLGDKARGTTGYAAVRPKHLLAAQIPLPPLTEQHRIVARIEALAAKVEAARQLREEALAKTTMLLDSSYHLIFNSSKLKPFLVRLGKADLVLNAENRDPVKEDPRDKFAYVDISVLPGGSPITLGAAPLVPTQQAPSRARRVIHKDDLIFSTVRPYLRTMAKIGGELDSEICSTGYAVVSCGKTIDPDFLLHQFYSPFFINQCMERVTGSHYPAVNLNNFQEVLIAVPPLPEQRRIVAHLDALQAKLTAVQAHQAATQARLDALLPSILDQAFRGKL